MKTRFAGPATTPPAICSYPLSAPTSWTAPPITLCGIPEGGGVCFPLPLPFTSPTTLTQTADCTWDGSQSISPYTIDFQLTLQIPGGGSPSFWRVQYSLSPGSDTWTFFKTVGPTPAGDYTPGSPCAIPIPLTISA